MRAAIVWVRACLKGVPRPQPTPLPGVLAALGKPHRPSKDVDWNLLSLKNEKEPIKPIFCSNLPSFEVWGFGLEEALSMKAHGTHSKANVASRVKGSLGLRI